MWDFFKCTHTHTYTHTYTHLHTPTHTLTHTLTHLHTHTPTDLHTPTHLHISTHLHTPTHLYTPTHTHLYTPTHTHIFIYHYFAPTVYLGYSTFLGYKLRLFRVNSNIFIAFQVHQVQIAKVTLNRNKKEGGFRGAQRVEIGVLCLVRLG